MWVLRVQLRFLYLWGKHSIDRAIFQTLGYVFWGGGEILGYSKYVGCIWQHLEIFLVVATWICDAVGIECSLGTLLCNLYCLWSPYCPCEYILGFNYSECCISAVSVAVMKHRPKTTQGRKCLFQLILSAHSLFLRKFRQKPETETIEQWFSTFQMLHPFNTVPGIVIPQP